MRIQTKIGLLIFVIAFIFIVAIGLFKSSEDEKVSNLYKERKKEIIASFHGAIESAGKSLALYAYDYTIWDEMIDFVNKPDSTWAYLNIYTTMSSFDVQFVWIYSTNLNLIYSANTLEQSAKQYFRLTREMSQEIFKNGYFTQFYLMTEKGLLEIRVAPVQPSNDLKRETKPQGYLFVGRLLTEKYLKDISIQTSAKVIFKETESEGLVKKVDNDKDFNVSITIPLKEWDGKPVMLLSLSRFVVSAKNLDDFLQKQVLYSLGFAVLVLVIVSISLFIVVGKPLKTISKSLEEKNTALLNGLLKDKAEFGKLSSLIVQFFKLSESSIQKLSSAIEQSPVSVIITNIRGEIEYVNPKFTWVSGYTSDEVIGKNPNILKSGSQSKNFIKNLWDTILSGKTWQGEFCNKKKNGELYWEHSIIAPIVDESGIITNFVAVKEDITEKKKQIEILRENEEKFRLVFDNSNDALFLGKPSGSIEAANPAACKMFQYTEKELISSGRDAIIDNSDPRYEFYLSERNLTNKNSYEVIFRRKNGKKFIGEVSSSVFRDKDGNLRTSTIIKDITERKKLELELIESKERAEEGNRLKSNFLANMSHELRTPMVGILGFANILSSRLKDPELIEMADTILKSGSRLTDTLNSILDLSRIESNKMDIKFSLVNLSEILSESVKLYRPIANNKGLYLDCIFPPEPVYIKSDKEILLRAFNNLINNAVKFTLKGGVTVKVYSPQNQPDKNIAVDIIDSGIGIPKEFNEIIFEPFRQVSDGFSRKFEGSGLGLSITKKIVELLNCSISFKSTLGEGSTFTILLPLSKLKEGIPKIFNNHSYGTKIRLDKLSIKPSILLVEDSPVNASVICAYLKNHALVDHFFNGSEAVEQCKVKSYDCVLMDINLIGIDGVETLHLIRQINEYYSKVPVVAVTAYAMAGDKEKFLSIGFTHYLSKPFQPDQLLNLLSEILEETLFIS